MFNLVKLEEFRLRLKSTTDVRLEEIKLEREKLEVRKLEIQSSKNSASSSGKISGGSSSKRSSRSLSRKSTGLSSPNASNFVLNYGSMEYAHPDCGEKVQSRYHLLLRKFAKRKYTFLKSGSICNVMKPSSSVPVVSFPYTEENLRACFLLLGNAENLEELFDDLTGQIQLPDYSNHDSPPDFKTQHN